MWKGIIGLAGLFLIIGLPLYVINAIADWNGKTPEDPD